MTADLTLRAQRLHVEGHEIQLEGVNLEDLLEQLELREIISFFGIDTVLDEIGESGIRNYYEEGGE